MAAVAGLALAGPATASAVRITIPRIGLDARLASTLRAGPVAYYRDHDTLAIAGHRTTYTRPFANLPRLRRGDAIRVGASRYVVRKLLVVRPREVWVLRYRGLVLSTCTPAGSASWRFVVLAAPVTQS